MTDGSIASRKQIAGPGFLVARLRFDGARTRNSRVMGRTISRARRGARCAVARGAVSAGGRAGSGAAGVRTVIERAAEGLRAGDRVELSAPAVGVE